MFQCSIKIQALSGFLSSRHCPDGEHIHRSQISLGEGGLRLLRVIWYQTVTESETDTVWLMSDVGRPSDSLQSQLMLTVTWLGSLTRASHTRPQWHVVMASSSWWPAHEADIPWWWPLTISDVPWCPGSVYTAHESVHSSCSHCAQTWLTPATAFSVISPGSRHLETGDCPSQSVMMSMSTICSSAIVAGQYCLCSSLTAAFGKVLSVVIWTRNCCAKDWL